MYHTLCPLVSLSALPVEEGMKPLLERSIFRKLKEISSRYLISVYSSRILSA